MSLLQKSHTKLKEILQSGDYAIDATAGNGHDTLKLAGYVSPNGEVLGIDIQDQAIKSTQALLSQHKMADSVTVVKGNHQDLEKLVPSKWHKKVKAIVFNLGFLPGSDKTVITQAESTLKALKASVKLLAPNGLLSVMLYPGHSGGDNEAEQVRAWARSLDETFKIKFIRGQSRSPKAPELLLVSLV